MSSITRFLLNLSIGAKLGIASGLGVLLVATMVIVQIRSNATTRDLDARMSGQQTIARDAVDAKASIAGMQIAVRDIRLANNPADLQKANDYLAARAQVGQPFCRRNAQIVQVRRESRPHREAQGESRQTMRRAPSRSWPFAVKRSPRQAAPTLQQRLRS